MKKVIVGLSIAFLASAVLAQTPPKQKLAALNDAGIAVKSGTTYKEANLKKGAITKPVMLRVSTGFWHHGSYNSMNLWFHRMGHMATGAYLMNRASVNGFRNKGEAYSLSKSKTKGPQNFLYTLIPAKDGKAKVIVYVSGSIYGKASLTFKVGRWAKTFTKPGTFKVKNEFVVTLQKGKPFNLPFGMNCALAVDKGFGKYMGTLSFYIVPTTTTPELAWGTYGKACGGKIGLEGTLGFGKKVYITLSNATKNSYAFLFIGNSDKRFYMFKLPLDLTGFGAPGCHLYTNIMRIVPVKTDNNGYAKVPFIIPGKWGHYFRTVFFQYAFACKKNKLGFLFTEGGKIYKK